MGGGIRLYKLGTWSCWIDELYTLDRALGPWGGDPRQPFLLLTRLSLQLFGVNAFALRFFPFLFGTLTLLGVYHLARAMFDRRVALLAVFCVTFSPWHIYLSQFGRAYAIVVFVTVWAALHFFRFLQTYRFVNLVLFLSLFAISFFLHNTAAFLLVIAVFVLLALSWLGPLKDTADARRMRLTAVLLVGVSLIFVPGFYRFVLHWHEKQLTSGYWGTTPLVFALKLAYHLTPTVAVAALLGSIQVLRKQTVKGVFLVCYLLLAPLALAFASAFRVNVSAKYTSLIIPAFAVAAACFVAHLTDQRKGKLALVGVLALVLLPSLETDYEYFGPGWGNRDRLREALRFINRHVAKEDLIIPVYLFKDPAEARFYVQGTARLQGIELDSSRILVPAREEELRDLPRAWLITIGKTIPPQQPDMYRWLASFTSLVAEFPARRGAQDNSVRVYFYPGPQNAGPLSEGKAEVPPLMKEQARKGGSRPTESPSGALSPREPKKSEPMR